VFDIPKPIVANSSMDRLVGNFFVFTIRDAAFHSNSCVGILSIVILFLYQLPCQAGAVLFYLSRLSSVVQISDIVLRDITFLVNRGHTYCR
jgi:hypothetical protein